MLTGRSWDTRATGPGYPPKGTGGRQRDSARQKTLLTTPEGRPPGTASHHHRSTQPPAGHARQRGSAGPRRPHNRPHSKWAGDPDSSPRGQAAGEGRVPDPGRPSQRRKVTPPVGVSPTPTACSAGSHAVGPVRGPPCPHRPEHTNNRSWIPRPPPEMGGKKRDSA